MAPVSDRAVLMRLQNVVFARASAQGDYARAERAALRRALLDPRTTGPGWTWPRPARARARWPARWRRWPRATPLDGGAALAARAAARAGPAAAELGEGGGGGRARPPSWRRLSAVRQGGRRDAVPPTAADDRAGRPTTASTSREVLRPRRMAVGVGAGGDSGLAPERKAEGCRELREGGGAPGADPRHRLSSCTVRRGLHVAEGRGPDGSHRGRSTSRATRPS